MRIIKFSPVLADEGRELQPAAPGLQGDAFAASECPSESFKTLDLPLRQTASSVFSPLFTSLVRWLCKAKRRVRYGVRSLKCHGNTVFAFTRHRAWRTGSRDPRWLRVKMARCDWVEQGTMWRSRCSTHTAWMAHKRHPLLWRGRQLDSISVHSGGRTRRRGRPERTILSVGESHQGQSVKRIAFPSGASSCFARADGPFSTLKSDAPKRWAS